MDLTPAATNVCKPLQAPSYMQLSIPHITLLQADVCSIVTDKLSEALLGAPCRGVGVPECWVDDKQPPHSVLLTNKRGRPCFVMVLG